MTARTTPRHGGDGQRVGDDAADDAPRAAPAPRVAVEPDEGHRLDEQQLHQQRRHDDSRVADDVGRDRDAEVAGVDVRGRERADDDGPGVAPPDQAGHQGVRRGGHEERGRRRHQVGDHRGADLDPADRQHHERGDGDEEGHLGQGPLGPGVEDAGMGEGDAAEDDDDDRDEAGQQGHDGPRRCPIGTGRCPPVVRTVAGPQPVAARTREWCA